MSYIFFFNYLQSQNWSINSSNTVENTRLVENRNTPVRRYTCYCQCVVIRTRHNIFFKERSTNVGPTRLTHVRPIPAGGQLYGARPWSWKFRRKRPKSRALTSRVRLRRRAGAVGDILWSSSPGGVRGAARRARMVSHAATGVRRADRRRTPDSEPLGGVYMSL